jgi:hypothetical protein
MKFMPLVLLCLFHRSPVNEEWYEQHFKTTSVVIAFVTPTGDKRAMQMKLWCEEQLVATPVYRFLSIPDKRHR